MAEPPMTDEVVLHLADDVNQRSVSDVTTERTVTNDATNDRNNDNATTPRNDESQFASGSPESASSSVSQSNEDLHSASSLSSRRQTQQVGHSSEVVQIKDDTDECQGVSRTTAEEKNHPNVERCLGNGIQDNHVIAECISSDLSSLSSDELRQLADIIFPMLNNIKSSLQGEALDSMSAARVVPVMVEGETNDRGVDVASSTEYSPSNEKQPFLPDDRENETRQLDSNRLPVQVDPESQPTAVNVTTPSAVVGSEAEQHELQNNDRISFFTETADVSENSSSSPTNQPSTSDFSLPVATQTEHHPRTTTTSEASSDAIDDESKDEKAPQSFSQRQCITDEKGTVTDQRCRVTSLDVDASTRSSSSGTGKSFEDDSCASCTEASNRLDSVWHAADEVDLPAKQQPQTTASVFGNVAYCNEVVNSTTSDGSEDSTSTAVIGSEQVAAIQQDAAEEEDRCLSKYQRIAVLMKLQKEMGVMQLEMSKLRDAMRSSDALLQQLIDSEFNDV